jgi:hypothetical protein
MLRASILSRRCEVTLSQPSTRLAGAAALALFSLAMTTPPARAQSVEEVMSEQAKADQAAAASQERVTKMHDETQDLAAKYRQALTDVDSINRYNEHLAGQVKSQTEEIASIQRQLGEIERTGRDVIPLMERMVSTLDQFVALDVPFLLEERTKRVQTLKELLPRADVTISEKYRRILEAYQIEMEYGRTLDAYETTLVGGDDDGDEAKLVECVRLGRISLMYRTPDGEETGYWDAEKKGWVRDDGYEHDVREALRVARKQGASDLLMVPVPAPRSAQ